MCPEHSNHSEKGNSLMNLGGQSPLLKRFEVGFLIAQVNLGVGAWRTRSTSALSTSLEP